MLGFVASRDEERGVTREVGHAQRREPALPRPDSADGARARSRATALLADMVDTAPRSRLERTGSGAGRP